MHHFISVPSFHVYTEYEHGMNAINHMHVYFDTLISSVHIFQMF